MASIGYLLSYEDDLCTLAMGHFGSKMTSKLRSIMYLCPAPEEGAPEVISRVHSRHPMVDLLGHVGLPGGGRAIIAVRGRDYPVKLLRDHFSLKASAQLVSGEEGYCLVLEDSDSYESRKLDKAEAIELNDTSSRNCLRAELQAWQLDDFRHVDTTRGALALVKLGLITSSNLQHCSSAIRDAYTYADLGL